MIYDIAALTPAGSSPGLNVLDAALDWLAPRSPLVVDALFRASVAEMHARWTLR